MTDFQATVSAICYSILAERCRAEEQGEFVHNRVVEFVLSQHRRMPDYLRLPLACLTLAFDCETLFRAGSRFHNLDCPARRPQIEAWRRSRLGPRRDLMRFYESLAIFGWHSAIHERNR